MRIELLMTHLYHFYWDYRKRLLRLVRSTICFCRLVSVAFADYDKHHILARQECFSKSDFLLCLTKNSNY